MAQNTIQNGLGTNDQTWRLAFEREISATANPIAMILPVCDGLAGDAAAILVFHASASLHPSDDGLPAAQLAESLLERLTACGLRCWVSGGCEIQVDAGHPVDQVTVSIEPTGSVSLNVTTRMWETGSMSLLKTARRAAVAMKMLGGVIYGRSGCPTREAEAAA